MYQLLYENLGDDQYYHPKKQSYLELHPFFLMAGCVLKSYQEDKPREGAHSQMDVVRTISFPDWRELQEEERVLIVDDLVDTGLTLKQILQYNNIINHNQPEKNWIFATLYNKPRSIFKPDHTVREFDNDEWIVFPWET